MRRPPLRALESALVAHRAELEAFVRARVAPADADDVLQLATLRATQHAAQLRDEERARAWLFRIVRNTLADSRRAARSRARVEAPTDEAPEQAPPVEADTCGCSVALARSLPPSQARLLELVDVRGAPVPEAARLLGITANNAAVRLHRARRALKARLLEHCGVTSARACQDCPCVEAGCCDDDAAATSR